MHGSGRAALELHSRSQAAEDWGKVSLEDTRHCCVVWLQPQRQLSNYKAALELTSSSRTAQVRSGSTRTAQQLSSCRRQGQSEPRGHTSLLCRVAPTTKAALELRSSSRTAQQLSNCMAWVGQRSKWKAAFNLHGWGWAALELHSSSQSATARARQLSNCQTGPHTEVCLEGTRVVWLQPLRTDCAH